MSLDRIVYRKLLIDLFTKIGINLNVMMGLVDLFRIKSNDGCLMIKLELIFLWYLLLESELLASF